MSCLNPSGEKNARKMKSVLSKANCTEGITEEQTQKIRHAVLS